MSVPPLQPPLSVPSRGLRVLVGAGCALSIPLLGLVDWVTGSEIGFSIFYLAPIMAAAWVCGWWTSAVLSALAAATWAVADLAAGAHYSRQLIPVWNGVMRAGVFLIVAYLFADLRRSLAREQAHSRVDSLTGVGNWRSFSELAERELGRSRRDRTPIAVAYLDLDDFKQVNDSLGHAAGDRVLSAVAGVLRRNTRALDFVARLGGDEFVVLLPETDQVGAAELFERIRGLVRETAQGGGWTFSIGLVVYRTPPASVADMVKLSDDLMYEAKQGGKDRICWRIVGAGAAGACLEAGPG